MAVAKSYENMQVVGEPFEHDGKMYVRVSGPCKRCGGSGHYSMNAQGDTTCYRCGGSGAVLKRRFLSQDRTGERSCRSDPSYP